MSSWAKANWFAAGFLLSMAIENAIDGNAWMALLGAILAAWNWFAAMSQKGAE